MHVRSVVIGAALGSVATFAIMGFIACEKPTNKNSAGAQPQPGAPPKGPTQPNVPTGPTLPAQTDVELNEPVARVDEIVITVRDLQDEIAKQSPHARARFTSLEQKKDLLDNRIRFEVMAKEAKKRNYDQDPEVVRTMKGVMIQKLMKVEFDKVKLEDVTDAEMQKFYEDHFAEYNRPEEVRVSAVLVKQAQTADEVAQKAKAAPPADNRAFRDLVTQYSEDVRSKQVSGDLKYFTADTKDVPPEVVDAAFKLEKTGDVAGPIATANGFYIIKQTGRHRALSKSFEEVRKQIQTRVYREKKNKAVEAFVEALRKSAKIQVNQEALARVRVETPAPPSMPGHGEEQEPGN